MFRAYDIDINDCSGVETHWEIQRQDGETEMYTVFSKPYPSSIMAELPDRGLSFSGDCFLYGSNSCFLDMTISPIDMRYNGSQITGVLNLPECFNSSHITGPMTLNIHEGTLYFRTTLL